MYVTNAVNAQNDLRREGRGGHGQEGALVGVVLSYGYGIHRCVFFLNVSNIVSNFQIKYKTKNKLF